MKHRKLEHLQITCGDENLDYRRARQLAEELAAGQLGDALLVAWFDGQKNEEHPQVPECQHKPGWLAYAHGHGGRLCIDVNGGEFSFVYADAGNLEGNA